MQRLAHLTITGRVQGVFYRQSTMREAHRLGILGWVRNQADGSVQALLCGEGDELETLIRWCQSGPPAAKVVAVQVKWLDTLSLAAQDQAEHELKFSDKFEIR